MKVTSESLVNVSSLISPGAKGIIFIYKSKLFFTMERSLYSYDGVNVLFIAVLSFSLTGASVYYLAGMKLAVIGPLSDPHGVYEMSMADLSLTKIMSVEQDLSLVSGITIDGTLLIPNHKGTDLFTISFGPLISVADNNFLLNSIIGPNELSKAFEKGLLDENASVLLFHSEIGVTDAITLCFILLETFKNTTSRASSLMIHVLENATEEQIEFVSRNFQILDSSDEIAAALDVVKMKQGLSRYLKLLSPASELFYSFNTKKSKKSSVKKSLDSNLRKVHELFDNISRVNFDEIEVFYPNYSEGFYQKVFAILSENDAIHSEIFPILPVKIISHLISSAFQMKFLSMAEQNFLGNLLVFNSTIDDFKIQEARRVNFDGSSTKSKIIDLLLLSNILKKEDLELLQDFEAGDKKTQSSDIDISREVTKISDIGISTGARLRGIQTMLSAFN